MVHEVRGGFHILVTDVNTLGHLAVVRSLGKAGHIVHAMSSQKDALGFKSNFASYTCICPEYDAREFIPWLRAYIKTHTIDLIIPTGGFLWTIKPFFTEFSPLLPLKSDENFIYTHYNKFGYFSKILQSQNGSIKENCPETILITKSNIPTLEALKKLRYPAFIKMDQAHALHRAKGDGMVVVDSPEQALQKIHGLLGDYDRFLIQGYVPGQKVGINLLMKAGEVKAVFVMIADHEAPHTGGVASLRRTWDNPEMLNDAIAKAQLIGWDGVQMLEYRWDRKTGKFALLEINLRFWAYLHLCLYAGIDFPQMLVDLYLGKQKTLAIVQPRQVTVRSLTYETGYFMSVLKDGRVNFSQKLLTIWIFIWNSLSGKIQSDGCYPGDRKIVVQEFILVIKNLMRKE